MIVSALAIMLMAGCGDKTGGETETLATVDPAKYVTLGEYKGLTAETEDTTVSEGDIERSIQSELAAHTEAVEVKGRAAQMGDIVNIDYVGLKDGVAFDTGSGTTDLKLGSGRFISGFEEGVVGMKTGEEKDLDLTFPEDYQTTELAGKDVVFQVTLNSISEEKVPELTDEFVQSLDYNVNTVEEYKQYVKNKLTEQNKSSAKASQESDLMKQAVDNAECDTDKLPEWLVSQNATEFKSSTESFVMQYGMTLEDYLAQTGGDMESFEASANEYGAEKAKSDLVVLAIAKAEGLEVTDKDMEDYYIEYANEYKATPEQIKNAIPEDELRNYLLQEKVMDFIYENAVFK